MFKKLIYLISISACLCTACLHKNSSSMKKDELTMVVGTYTQGTSKGIYTFRFNQETGVHSLLSETEIINPSYLSISKDNKFIYAVSECGDGREAISAFAFNRAKGTLTLVNSQPSMGADPCYVTINEKNAVIANYSGGNISVFPIQEDGSLLPASDAISFSGKGPNKSRQEQSHLHFVEFTPDGKHLLANDLGADKIYKFKINTNASVTNNEKLLTKGTPAAFDIKAGSGPRHLTFSPCGQYVYLLNELSGEIVAFNYNEGELEEFQTILADSTGAQGSADIHTSPDGKFLYASNRLQEDGLAIFSIDPFDGKLTQTGYQLTGSHPRNFNITPNGKYLLVACRDSNAIEIYERNPANGLLSKINEDIKISQPVCIRFAN